MKTLTIAIATLLLSGSAPVLAQNDLKEQLTVPLTDPNKPGSLEVNLMHGSIRVVGYSGKEVVIDVAPESSQPVKSKENSDNPNERLNENLNENLNRGKRDDSKLSEGMRRIDTRSNVDIVAEERNNVVKLTHRSLVKGVNYTIKVPQRFDLKLKSLNNRISVENVTGTIEVSNLNSSIDLVNISGSAVASTINGTIKATFRDVSNAPMAFSTLNGRIDVTFPASVKANIKLKSDRGDFYTDFDLDVEKRQPKTERTTDSGTYRVSIDDWVYGKINGGGPEVMMKSMQGNIYVRKAK